MQINTTANYLIFVVLAMNLSIYLSSLKLFGRKGETVCLLSLN